MGSNATVRTLAISNISAATNHFSTAWINGDPTTTVDPSDPVASQLHPITSKEPCIQVSTFGQWDWIRVNGNDVNTNISVSIPNISSFAANAANVRLVG